MRRTSTGRTLGIDPQSGTDEVYVPDIGDNLLNRDGRRPLPVVYRLPEPDVSAAGPKVTADLSVEAFSIRYADEQGRLIPPQNAEAFFVDPVSHDRFIVDKTPTVVNGTNQYGVFQLPATLSPTGVNLARGSRRSSRGSRLRRPPPPTVGW